MTPGRITRAHEQIVRSVLCGDGTGRREVMGGGADHRSAGGGGAIEEPSPDGGYGRRFVFFDVYPVGDGGGAAETSSLATTRNGGEAEAESRKDTMRLVSGTTPC